MSYLPDLHYVAPGMSKFLRVWSEICRLSFGKSSLYQRLSLNTFCAKRRTGTGGYLKTF
jgi:hypothetical protein